MKRIPFILALVLIIACSNNGKDNKNGKFDLQETQKWLKKHGKTYTLNELKNLQKLDLSHTQVIDINLTQRV